MSGGYRCPWCDFSDVLAQFLAAHIAREHPDKETPK